MTAVGHRCSTPWATSQRRNLSIEDLDDVLEIENQSFSEPWSKDQLACAIGDQSAICIGLRLDGQLIGYTIGYLEAATFHLATLAIVRSQRGRGRGSNLLCEVLQHASELGCDRCTLEVRGLNQEARRLYGRHGFTAAEIRRDYYQNPRDHAVLMSRSL